MQNRSRLKCYFQLCHSKESKKIQPLKILKSQFAAQEMPSNSTEQSYPNEKDEEVFLECKLLYLRNVQSCVWISAG
jgi:hypothetical protein